MSHPLERFHRSVHSPHSQLFKDVPHSSRIDLLPAFSFVVGPHWSASIFSTALSSRASPRLSATIAHLVMPEQVPPPAAERRRTPPGGDSRASCADARCRTHDAGFRARRGRARRRHPVGISSRIAAHGQLLHGRCHTQSGAACIPSMTNLIVRRGRARALQPAPEAPGATGESASVREWTGSHRI